MKKSISLLLSGLIVIALSFYSCDSRKVFREFEKIPGYSWERDQTITFQTEINKENGPLDINLELRHSSFFPYKEMAVVFRIIGPDGSVRSAEHIIAIRDEKGDFIGDGMGDLWDVSFSLYEGLSLNESGTYTFEVDNVMPRVRVAGIMEVGLLIRKAKTPIEETGN
jgi:gliding motility-associated lipoprotein GldH